MIGVFDSGSGGLTVLRRIRARMPRADLLYFGDIRNAPYGERSREELARLTLAAMSRLREGGATSIVSACNSVSASLVASRSSGGPERLIEMVGPTVASLRDDERRLLVVATPATIASRLYEDGFRALGKEVGSLALPGLAGAIEKGDEAAAKAIIHASLAGVAGAYDAVVLACTHYPLVTRLFAEDLPGIELIDPADAVAARVAEEWSQEEQGNGTTHFLISADSAPFRALVAKLFPESEARIEVIE